MVIALIRAWHELRVERDQLVDNRSPKFEIVFMPANDEESRPFLQRLAFQQQVPVVTGGDVGSGVTSPLGYARRDFVDRRYRVGIVNLSSAMVPSVSLTLASCEPGGTYVHVGHHLLVMDSDPPV